MTRRTLLALCLAANCGCASLPSAGLRPTAPASDTAAASTAPRELPAAKAAQACLVTARALEQQKHYGEAIVEYEKARQHNPRLTEVSRRLAVLYDRQGADERALVEYDKALLLHPHDADLLNDMGYFYQKRGDWAQGEPWLRRALASDARHQRAWVNLGVGLAHQGRYDDSFAAFARVLKPAEAHSNVGVILVKEGKRDEARQAFRQALALQPDLKQAQAILRVLDNPSAPTERAASFTAEK